MKLQRLSEEKIQYLVYQMLKGLKVESTVFSDILWTIYFLCLIVPLIKFLLFSFIPVHPLSWYNSQGESS